MAYTATHSAARNDFGGIVARGLSTLFGGLVRIAENNPRMRQVAALSALTDAELADRGIKREDIARHVFGDRFYL